MTIEQFMPSKQNAEDPRKMKPEDISERVKLLAEMLGGNFINGQANR